MTDFTQDEKQLAQWLRETVYFEEEVHGATEKEAWLLTAQALQKKMIDKEEMFDEQLRILGCCSHIDTDNEVAMRGKYLMEMMVRPLFGDSENHYYRINEVTDELKSHFLENEEKC